MTDQWQPPYSLEERLKYALVPPRLYLRQLARRALKKGERELRLLASLVPPDKVAVDVGANKGIYTYHLSRVAKSVVAFEPNPKMYRILRRGLPVNATAHQVALSNRTGTAPLIIPGRSGAYSNQRGTLATQSDRHGDDGHIDVELRTLDSFGLDNVGFIKIDVEGHEREVLEGATDILRRDRPVLLIEIEQKHTGRPIEDDLADVMARGYAGYFATDQGLESLDRFDGDRHHRNPEQAGGYIFNFIFAPADMSIDIPAQN